MEQIISGVIKKLFDVDQDVVLTRPEPQFGDYATNVALQYWKQFTQAVDSDFHSGIKLAVTNRPPSNPIELAEIIAAELRKNNDFSDVTVAGPGFINLKLSNAGLLALTKKEPELVYAGKNLVFEYSCPNAFKELHTGHLYQTIYGDIVARLMLIGGAKLQRTSFGGDVGLHVAKCLWGMRERLGGEHPEKLADIPPDAFERSKWISESYVLGAKAYEENAAKKQQIDQLNKTIYGFHDNKDYTSPLAKIYWETRMWSFEYFDAFYSLIDVVPMRYYPESQTAPVGLEVVQEQLEKGILKRSDGAVVYEGDESKHLHTRVFITSQGLPTYETKDIGVIWLEKQDFSFDHRYLLTGNDQKEYMRVVFAAAEEFSPELAGAMTHFTNGTVRFGDGKKMSSRLGNVSRAIEVIDAVKEKVAELVDDISLVDTVALGAVKYAFARYRLGGDINFDIDETVSLQGNSGPYLQYAHARAKSILAKATATPAIITQIHDEDRALVRKLGEYHEVVSHATRELAPHHICNYLFELAQEFNRYYEKNQVVGSDKEAHRAGLVTLYADTVKAGLTILGISAPEKM